MDKEKILIIDDERDMLRGCQKFLETAGYAVVIAESGEDGLALFETENPDLTIVDLKMPGMDGMAVLQSIMARDQEAVVIVFTGYGTIESAVKAIRAGAFDFVQKPFDPDAFLIVIERALKLRCVREENIALKEMLDTRFRFENIIGNSEAITQVFDLMRKISDIDANVLITGESGTGKELVAQCIHANSKRSHKPFVPLNCGGLPENLVESEIFGHVKGAFTDAKQSRVGLIEHARGGTFFLDEIGELPMPLQVKFLRVLEDHKIRRLGSNEEIEIDIRLISATNQNLLELVESGAFREDLLYRLNLIVLHLPPLRQRPEDIPLLARHFALGAAQAYRRDLEIDDAALSWLQTLPWPGNIRQLKQLVERTALMSPSSVLGTDDFSAALSMQPEEGQSGSGDLPAPGTMTLDELERSMIVRCMERYQGNISRVAQALGLSRAALYRRFEKYGIDP